MNETHYMFAGPAAVPPEVFQYMQQPLIHHRTPEFRQFFADFQRCLQRMLLTEGPVITFPAAGTLAMEMAMKHIIRPQQQVVVAVGGKFSERWYDFAAASGAKVTPLHLDSGFSPDPEQIFQVIGKQFTDVLILTHCETSTGAYTDLEHIILHLREKFPDLIIMVDAVSTAGIDPLYQEAWGIDVLVTSSQKGLMNPAGIGIIGFRKGAEALVSDGKTSMDLKIYLDALNENEFPFTPPVYGFYGLKGYLDWLDEQGLPVIWNRFHQAAKIARDAVRFSGGTLIPEQYGNAVTVFRPEGITADRLIDNLAGQGVLVSGGQGRLKGEIVRAGHFQMDPVASAEAFARALHRSV